jgi:hypothetical protein
VGDHLGIPPVVCFCFLFCRCTFPATSIHFTSSLYHLSIWNAVNLNGNLVVTAVAKSIVKSPDPLRLVRQASPTLRLGNTVGLERLIAQIEIGRPEIAIYHAHASAIVNSFQHCYSQEHLELTRDFVLHRAAATVVPEHDFVVRVAAALQFPARRGAHAALGLLDRAVEVVVVVDVDVHGVVEGA